MSRKQKEFFLHAVINANILDSMVAGKVPWERNWAVKDFPMPYHAHSGNPITGINAIHLATEVIKHGYESNGWISRNRLKELGGNPVGDERPTADILMVVNISKDPEKPFYRNRYYKAYNLDQTENLPAKFYAYRNNTGKNTFSPFVADLVKKVGLTVKTGSAQAYNLKTDTLTLPTQKSFKSKALYEAMVCKGLILSTLHESRLGREVSDSVTEALICEIGAYFLMANNGTLKSTTNPELLSKYIGRMDKDHHWFANAVKVAMSAVRYILDEPKAQQSDDDDDVAEVSSVIAIAG